MEEIDALRMELAALLPAASRRWLRFIDTRLAPLEVTSSLSVPLILLGRLGGGVNQAMLAEQMGVVGPSLVRILDKLVDMGLAERRPDPANRRSNTLWLTDEGAAMSRRLEQNMLDVRREALAGFSADELRTAIRVHEALLASSP